MNSHGNTRSKYFLSALGSAMFLTLAFSMISCVKKNSTTAPARRNAEVFEGAVDVNRANAKELEKLPGVGPKTAMEIIEFRQKYGNFRKVEHLMLLPEISDKRFRKFRTMIKTR